MKKLVAFALVLSLGLFAVGCSKPAAPAKKGEPAKAAAGVKKDEPKGAAPAADVKKEEPKKEEPKGK